LLRFLLTTYGCEAHVLQSYGPSQQWGPKEWPPATHEGVDQLHFWRRLDAGADEASAKVVDIASNIRHLMQLENRCGCLSGTSLPELSETVRAQLVDWLMECVEVFDLDSVSAFRALSYFDSLQNEPPLVPHRKPKFYQAMLGCCLVVASRTTAVNLALKDVLFSCDNRFSTDDCHQCIKEMMDCCHATLAGPVVSDVLNEFILCMGLANDDSETEMLLWYVSELALMTLAHRRYSVSLIAVVVIGLFTLKRPSVWPQCLAEATGYSKSSLKDCVFTLSESIYNLQRRFPELWIVRRRYRNKVASSHLWVPAITAAELANEVR